MISLFDMFKIGIGPSSSHTVGPMKAAAEFAAGLEADGLIDRVARVQADLYGSLALTGEGHGTVSATLLGLEGALPHLVNPDEVQPRFRALQAGTPLKLAGRREIGFDFATDVRLNRHQFLKPHSNGMQFAAFDAAGHCLREQRYYSIGGGFVVTEEQFGEPLAEREMPPYPFSSSAELLAHCRREQKPVADIVLANEFFWHNEADVRQRLLDIAEVMKGCIEAGCRHDGVLPGGLQVKRRAPSIFRKLVSQQLAGRMDIMLWPMLYAMAVNEENAAGGRVVTAPTNGAAGIVPSVLQYFRNFNARASDAAVVDFLATAGAIGMLYKMGASISGAEVGCQGEVGVACSMAAGAYCAALGGSPAQVENAAEMAMEHHLGLTCDPVGGLVQIPCIERNGIAAEKAIKIAQLALLEDGQHKVSLDTVIATMLATGRDMLATYKETSLAGLAVTVNMTEC
ncbi:L-serine ammonia-lyase [Laribacter hongkongensis]|uniref:L-serine ammonia-lyase n=1 Tax=Laribacter hongkongensis TaxID=168471 RepID=UPI001EFECBC1|nr:L-serine ammonia-lyase [Laribacter hongkongensis]MCG9077409.1 L-serine ammonia-lyase [Laribacter hongkongensis]